MKQKKLNKKLSLNKATVVNLGNEAMRAAKGGNLWKSYVEETVCCSDPDPCATGGYYTFCDGCHTVAPYGSVCLSICTI